MVDGLSTLAGILDLKAGVVGLPDYLDGVVLDGRDPDVAEIAVVRQFLEPLAVGLDLSFEINCFHG